MDDKVFTIAGLINPDHNFIAGFHTLLVALIILLFARVATHKMQIVPNGIQNVYEFILSGIITFCKDIVGEDIARKYFPLAATIAFFVFFSNVIGVIPGFEAPTSNLSFTLVLALVVFFYYHFEGIRAQGAFTYFKHFAGPVLWLAPLMFPVEVISHLSRVISLSFRLFGNIKGDDMFLFVMLMLVTWVVPVVPFVILAFMAALQAFVFMVLTYVYIQGAVVVDEH